MAFAPTSPVTGAAQTGFTSPTYTFVTDNAPDVNGKQFAVSAVGGTQVGVIISSVSAPFTTTFVKPKVFKALGKAHPVTGVISSVPRNIYTHVTRKAVLPLAGQPYTPMLIRTSIEVPAGADIADAANIRAALSFHYGIGSQIPAAIGDTVISGTI